MRTFQLVFVDHNGVEREVFSSSDVAEVINVDAAYRRAHPYIPTRVYRIDREELDPRELHR